MYVYKGVYRNIYIYDSQIQHDERVSVQCNAIQSKTHNIMCNTRVCVQRSYIFVSVCARARQLDGSARRSPGSRARTETGYAVKVN